MLHIVVLHEENCPSCDEVIAQLEGLKNEFPEIRVRRRLLDEEPELTGRLGVVATPAVIVNDQLAFQGQPQPDFLAAYLKNVRQGLHDDPDAYPPLNERHPDNQGQEATGSMDPEWRGSGRRPAGRGSHSGRHS
jgi:hypothetical protein